MMSDSVAGSRLLAGLASLWPTIRTVIADAGHTSRKLAGQLRRDGWQIASLQRRQRVFAIAGLTWIVERSFAWLGFNRRLAKDYEPGANLGDLDLHRRNSPDAEPDRAGMTFDTASYGRTVSNPLHETYPMREALVALMPKDRRDHADWNLGQLAPGVV
jgi:transposase